MMPSGPLPDWSALRGARILRQFSSGPVVDSWLVELANELCVLRIDRPMARDLGLDRASELQVLNLVAETGMAPKVIAASPSLGYLLLEYVPGIGMAPSDIRQPVNLQAVAGLLARLHRLTISSSPVKAFADVSLIKSLQLTEAAKRYAKLAQQATAKEILPQIDSELGKLDAFSADLVVCHHDCHPGNILFATNKAPRLIDWEYAALGNAHFDLAVFISGAQLDPSDTDHFLTAYSLAGGSVDLVALGHWQKIQRCIGRLWECAVRRRLAEIQGKR